MKMSGTPVAIGVTVQLLPAAEAYCTDHPLILTAVDPAFSSSTKSFFHVAPLLPPPPYTWLITTCACEPGTSDVSAASSKHTPAARRNEKRLNGISAKYRRGSALGQ